MSWNRPRNTEQRACRMGRMIDRLEVDRGRVARAEGGMVIATAMQNCQDCQTVPECLAWLEQPASSSPATDFCPNAATFAGYKKG